jgi:hypothetical protein
MAKAGIITSVQNKIVHVAKAGIEGAKTIADSTASAVMESSAVKMAGGTIVRTTKRAKVLIGKTRKTKKKVTSSKAKKSSRSKKSKRKMFRRK